MHVHWERELDHVTVTADLGKSGFKGGEDGNRLHRAAEPEGGGSRWAPSFPKVWLGRAMGSEAGGGRWGVLFRAEPQAPAPLSPTDG